MLWQGKKRNVRLESKLASGRLPWLMRIIHENPFTALWNAILFFGGTVLLLYHAKISYLPDFSLSDLAGLLASVTLIGLGLVLALTASFFLPSLILLQSDSPNTNASQVRTFDNKREQIALLLLPALIWLTEFLLDPQVLITLCLLFVSPLVAMVVFAIYIDREAQDSWLRHLIRYLWNNKKKFLALFIWTVLFGIPAQLAMVLALAGEPGSVEFFFPWMLIIFLIINTVVYTQGTKNWLEPLAIGTLMVGIVFPLLSGRPLLWPELTVQKLALGNRNAAEVIVSYKQCQSFAKFGLACDYEEKKDHELALSNVNVLSRVGTSVLLELLVDTQAVKLPTTAHAARNLSTTERERYCSGGSGNDMLCSACDGLTLEKVTINTRGNKVADSEDAVRRYKNGLACVQVSIPKDQVTSMSLSNSRRYSGFTSIIESAGSTH